MDVWWSASLRLVVFVAGESAEEVQSVVVLRAPEADWDRAFKRALEIGHRMERSYANDEGKEIAWRLGAVLTLDQLEDEIADGRELYFARSSGDGVALTPDDLQPDEERPTQTGV
ncbi:MAG TPA: DUF4288 domain-containing protein [Gaiellaceae bacterium]|nr:DUF4288 domain-containing protein [Gaiellaceae bacterium]